MRRVPTCQNRVVSGVFQISGYIVSRPVVTWGAKGSSAPSELLAPTPVTCWNTPKTRCSGATLALPLAPPHTSVVISGFYAYQWPGIPDPMTYQYGCWPTFWSLYCNSHKDSASVFSQALSLVRISLPLQGRKPRVGTTCTGRTGDDITAPILADVFHKRGVSCVSKLNMAASLLPRVRLACSAVLPHPFRGPSYIVTDCSDFGHLCQQLWFLIVLTSVRRQCTTGQGSAWQGRAEIVLISLDILFSHHASNLLSLR